MQQTVHSRMHRLPSMLARMRFRVTLLVLVASLPFVLWSVLPIGSSADQTPGQIQRKIDRNKSLIGGHKARERVLTSDISNQTHRINTLQSDITRLSTRQQKLQTSLDAKRRELALVQTRLRQQRARRFTPRRENPLTREHLVRRLTAIFAADVAGYSRLTGMDEEGTHVRLKEHLRVLIDPKIAAYRGHIVKNTGDGFQAAFVNAPEA